MLGLDTPDDAAVYRIDDKLALVQTVDFFTPVVDDAYTWGAIAVANAMSDVYAMGARPLLGLNLVGWPSELDLGLLAEVLEGGHDKAREAGASVIGGHTVDDPEPKFGMAVTGTVSPDSIVRQSSAAPGMVIVLTKPLGMGIISTAIKRGKADPALISKASDLMSALNAGSAKAMTEVGAGAATDVTGFGLIGHLQQMAKSSGVGAELWAESVPVLEGVKELASQDLVPGGTRRNESYFGKWTEFATDVDEATRTVLFDAQTSGGLLIAVEEGKQDQMIQALMDHQAPVQAVIGRFVEGAAGSMSIRGRS